MNRGKNASDGGWSDWNPAKNAREKLFSDAGISKSEYYDFDAAIDNWINHNGKQRIRLAVKEIVEENQNLSPLAKCLLVENAINRLYFQQEKEVNQLRLFRGLKGEIADQVKEASAKGATKFEMPQRLAESYSSNLAKAQNDFAGIGGIVIGRKIPVEDILLSHKTNQIFHGHYKEEKESVIMSRSNTQTFDLEKEGIRVVKKLKVKKPKISIGYDKKSLMTPITTDIPSGEG